MKDVKLKSPHQVPIKINEKNTHMNIQHHKSSEYCA